MTKLTNKLNLPEPIYDAVKADPYKGGGWISTTTLIDAPRIRVLKKIYKEELTEDASEMLWALLGSAVHGVLERANIKNERKRAFLTVIETLKDEAEKRTGLDKVALETLAEKIFQLLPVFFPELEGRYIFEIRLSYEYRGKTLTGAFDLYDTWTNTLYDYKMCSVFAYIFPESRKKWAAQTNIYAFMLRNTGKKVDAIKIVAIFRDFSQSKANFGQGDYPKQQILTIDIKVVDHERMRAYIHKRMDMHIEAEEGTSEVLPLCNGEERWSTSDEYAVRPEKAVRAVRVFDNEAMAKDFVDKQAHKYDKKLFIYLRPGENRRCDNWCPVKDFCSQKKENDERIKQLKDKEK